MAKKWKDEFGVGKRELEEKKQKEFDKKLKERFSLTETDCMVLHLLEKLDKPDEWMKMIEEKSKGRVKITPYWSGSLLSVPEVYRGIASGLADCGMYVTGLNPGIQSLNLYVSLPFLGYPSGRAAVEVYNAVWKKFPEIEAEFTKTGAKVAYASFMEPNQLHLTVDKIVKTPEELKTAILKGFDEKGPTLIEVPVGDMPNPWHMLMQQHVRPKKKN